MDINTQEEDSQSGRVAVKQIASIQLTEQHVQKALVALVSENEDLKDALKDRRAFSWITWHVNKWDNKEAFCTLSFGVADDQTQDQQEQPGDDAIDVTAGGE